MYNRAFAKNGVSMLPGLRRVTEMGAPSSSSSIRSESVNPLMACFAAQ
jgi:hypothetical protein